MSRSKWKPKYSNPIFFVQQNKKKAQILLNNRQTYITKQMLGRNVYVYNGIKYFFIKINLDKIGHKVGEFAPTRKKPIFKKLKKKKK